MTTSEETLYVIVPCFNEEENLDATMRSILRHADTLEIPVRVLMVDDGSTDGTRGKMEAVAAGDPRCTVIANERNLGMGRSVIDTWGRIPDGSWVTVMPGDGEFTFESIGNYLEVRDRYDLIIGYLQNPVIRPISRRLASWAFTKVVATLYGFPWRYLNGLKMYRVEIFRGIPIVSSGHAFTAEIIAKAQLRMPRLRVGEVPFAARGRRAGASKAIRPFSILRAVREVWTGARSVSRYREEMARRSPQEE